MQQAGLIQRLAVHTTIKLYVNGRPVLIRSPRYHNGRHATYTDDFRYEERDPKYGGWVLVVEDHKGWDMPEARFKRAVYEAMTGVPIRVHGGQKARSRKAARSTSPSGRSARGSAGPAGARLPAPGT
jgi:hypothetical protein